MENQAMSSPLTTWCLSRTAAPPLLRLGIKWARGGCVGAKPPAPRRLF